MGKDVKLYAQPSPPVWGGGHNGLIVTGVIKTGPRTNDAAPVGHLKIDEGILCD